MRVTHQTLTFCSKGTDQNAIQTDGYIELRKSTRNFICTKATTLLKIVLH